MSQEELHGVARGAPWRRNRSGKEAKEGMCGGIRRGGATWSRKYMKISIVTDISEGCLEYFKTKFRF